jgi:SAM-dependent methyltransferase
MPTDPLDYPRYFWHLLNGFRVRHEQSLAAFRADDVQPFLDLRQPRVILDLANGRLRPQYTLLRAAGHRVYGIDLINQPRRELTDASYVVARRLFAWRQGIRSQIANGPLVNGTVNELPFASNTFELITSIAAFEHFLDVPKVVTEMERVIRPGGIVWICIHLFTTLSGGHNVSLTQIPLQRVPRDVEPWDHLRKRRLPFHVPLNEWRISHYLTCFAQHFEILKNYCAMREGEGLLNSEIEHELAGYTRDELTCPAYVILARKRESNA